MTKEQRTDNGGRTISLRNSGRKMGQPHAGERSLITILLHIQKLTQNGLIKFILRAKELEELK